MFRFLKKNILFIPLFVFALASGAQANSKIAMIDVAAIINSGPHAKQAVAEIAKAQEIYQYNLDVIERILEGYRNKKQAQGYLIEAARQLQTQLNDSRLQVEQALTNTLTEVLAANTAAYDIVINSSGIIHIKSAGANGNAHRPTDITKEIQNIYDVTRVQYPTLPERISNPGLPPDTGAN